MNKIRHDLKGIRFGYLIALKPAKPKVYGIKNARTYSTWLCKCDCGNTKIVTSNHLKTSQVISCGCAPKWSLEKSLAAKRRLFRSYKEKAKVRCLSFNLSFSKFLEYTSEKCYYCGDAPKTSVANGMGKDSTKLNGDYIYNGIDRLDSKIGYSVKNCVTSCTTCNKAKMSMGHNEFLNMVEKIYNNRIK